MSKENTLAGIYGAWKKGKEERGDSGHAGNGSPSVDAFIPPAGLENIRRGVQCCIYIASVYIRVLRGHGLADGRTWLGCVWERENGARLWRNYGPIVDRPGDEMKRRSHSPRRLINSSQFLIPSRYLDVQRAGSFYDASHRHSKQLVPERIEIDEILFSLI